MYGGPSWAGAAPQHERPGAGAGGGEIFRQWKESPPECRNIAVEGRARVICLKLYAKIVGKNVKLRGIFQLGVKELH